jgi:large-conductance mechanosensitive channel
MESCIPCPVGTYNDMERSYNCVPCEENTFNNESGSIMCKKCPLKTYTKEKGSIECDIECPEGTYLKETNRTISCIQIVCNLGMYYDAGICKPCGIGTYGKEENGKNSCIPCKDNEYTTKSGSLSFEDCKTCPEGTYLDKNEENNISKCQLCDAGTYSIGGVVGMSSCLECLPGTYSPLGSSACLLCDKGSYSNTNKSSLCLECDFGWYAEEQGSVSCTKFPDNTIYPNTTLSISFSICKNKTNINFENKSKNNSEYESLLWIIFGIISGVLLVILTVVIFILIKKHNTPQNEENVQLEDMDEENEQKENLINDVINNEQTNTFVEESNEIMEISTITNIDNR